MKLQRVAVCIALAVVLLALPVVMGGEDGSGSALDVVPVDAAFFASWSRQGEQFERLRESRAFAEFMEIPQVREVLGPVLLGEYDEENPNHVTMKQWLAQPFVQVGLEAVSHEVFLYGDVSFTELVHQIQDMVASGRRHRLQALAAGKTAKAADLEASLATVGKLGELRVPNLVFGFRVKDPLRARSQLMLLDMLTQLGLMRNDVPPWVRERYGHEAVQGQRFVTFKVDGSMLLMTGIKFEEGAAPELVAALKAALERVEMVVAVGFLGDHVLVSIGDSTEHLEQFGKGDSLSGHADLGPLVELTDERLTSVRYVSSDYRAALAAKPGQVPELVELIRASTESDESLSEETRVKVKEALAALEKEKRPGGTRPAAVLGFSYLTSSGYEGFRYGDAAQAPELDGPMRVLLHVGADPIVVSARRDWIGSVEDYGRFSDWLVSVARPVGQAIDAGNDEGVRYLWYQVCDLARQFDTIMGEQIVPVLAHGEAALVISATDRARKWHADMPAAEEPLPLPELGLVVETSDPEGLLEGVEDAYQVVQAGIRLVSDAAEEIPPLMPEIEDTAMGRLYYLAMWPELTRIDPDLLAPTAGLSDRWLVVTLRPKTATALLRRTGWIPAEFSAEEQARLTSLRHVRPEGFVQIVLDWMGYVEENLTEEPSEEDAALLEAYRGALRLLGCWKSYTRSVSLDGERLVTHSVWRFEDVQ